MAPESPGNLVALDLEWRNTRLECRVDRYDPTGLSFLHVSWNAIDCPERYVPVGSGVAYAWLPPDFEHRRYRARVDIAGDGFEWLDRAFGVGLMLILILPPKCIYVFPSVGISSSRPIRFKSTADGRMALYWWLQGSQDGRVDVSWQMACSSVMDIEAQCELLNQEARRIQPRGIPVHVDLRPDDTVKSSAQPPILDDPPSWHISIGELIMNTGSTNITNTITDSPGAITNLARQMSNVANTVNQQMNASAASEEVKILVKQLADQIAALSSSTNPEKIKEMGDDLMTLSNEMTKAEPRRKWYELSLEGIKSAALAVGEIAKPIVDTVTTLGSLLIP
jgi:hypothetical protein